jgi:hypothetical protein
MSFITLANPATAAATVTFDAGQYQSVTFSASNITAAETVDVYIRTPDGDDLLLAWWDGRTNAIDATNLAVTVTGGPVYAIVKSVTAGASGLYASPCVFKA